VKLHLSGCGRNYADEHRTDLILKDKLASLSVPVSWCLRQKENCFMGKPLLHIGIQFGT
jgi:hypothetical protein